jgi:hypothetical protein
MNQNFCAIIGRRLIMFVLLSVAVAFPGRLVHSESIKENVFFGGFAFSGSSVDVERSFPVASKLNRTTDDGTPYLGRVAREFFQKNKERFIQMTLQFGVARHEDTSLVLALALTDEKVLKEEFSVFHKLVVQLGFEVLILNFKDHEVVCSQPIYIELVDANSHPFSDAVVEERIKEMISGHESQLFAAIMAKADKIYPRGKNQSTLQIRQVTVGEKALPFLPDALRRIPSAYAQTVAQQFGSLLSSRAGVVLLPYAKDGLNAKMALVFSDASAVQFKIPASTFAVDVDVKGFKKILDKSTEAEELWIYGAFLGVRVYEPEFKTVYFDAPVKYGVSKVIPSTQKNVDEFPIVSEALKGAFVSAVGQMEKDKATKNKVLNKCRL